MEQEQNEGLSRRRQVSVRTICYTGSDEVWYEVCVHKLWFLFWVAGKERRDQDGDL